MYDISTQHHRHELDPAMQGRAVTELKRASVINFGLSVGEKVTSIFGHGKALLAEGIHNGFDSASYFLATYAFQTHKMGNYNKAIWLARGMALAGAGYVSVKSGVSLVEGESHSIEPYVLPVAVAGGATNAVVAHRIHGLEDQVPEELREIIDSGHDHEQKRKLAALNFTKVHALTDALGSIITVSTTALAYKGLEQADNVGGLSVGLLTIGILANHIRKHR